MPIAGNTVCLSKSLCARKKMVSTRSSKLEFKFFEGERVLCFEPDVTKARVLYDAKVLEIKVKKDGRGRRSVEYLIHFQGWNSSWDRFVKESFILHDTTENRTLQKELAVAARSLLKEKRRKRQKLALKGAEPKYKTDSESSSSAEEGDSGTRSSFDDEKQETSEAAESRDGEENQQEEDLFINVPEPVKKVLEEDYFHIKHYKKLLSVPCEPNVVTLLEGFVRNFACNLVCKTPEKPRAHRSSTCSNNSQSGAELGSLSSTSNSLAVCKEVVDGLRVSFDFLLPLTLLYDPERPQFDQLKNSADLHTLKAEPQTSSTSIVVDNALFHDAAQWRVLTDQADGQFLPSKAYGLVHLLRLLVRLPDVIQKMSFSHDKKVTVVNYSELLLQYLSRQTNLVSEANYIADPFS